MTDDGERLLACIGEARTTDGETLRDLNYRAVPGGLFVPYELFHAAHATARYVGVATDCWGRECRVVWKLASDDGGVILGSIAIPLDRFQALPVAQISDEEVEGFVDFSRDETARRVAEFERVFRERFREQVRDHTRRHPLP